MRTGAMAEVSLSRLWLLEAMAAFLLVSGCASDRETLDPTRPYPTLGKAQRTRSFASSLQVFTDTWIDVNVGSGDDGSVRRPTGYTVFTDRGHEMQYVRNYLGAVDTEPTRLELDPGRYLIRLDKPGKHPPVFWVVVEPEQLTEVTFR
jgi:hypothetical protein